MAVYVYTNDYEIQLLSEYCRGEGDGGEEELDEEDDDCDCPSGGKRERGSWVGRFLTANGEEIWDQAPLEILFLLISMATRHVSWSPPMFTPLMCPPSLELKSTDRLLIKDPGLSKLSTISAPSPTLSADGNSLRRSVSRVSLNNIPPLLTQAQ